jgi:hypothetical protein
MYRQHSLFRAHGAGCTSCSDHHTQGSIGYDVAIMRLNYQRLKWDSSAIQRILHGDTTRGRRAKAQGTLCAYSDDMGVADAEYEIA